MGFGEIDYFQLGVLVTVGIAAVTDVFKGKIYNALTLSSLILGSAVHAYESGWSGLSFSLGGIGVALLLYGWIFAIGQMGGGDVKLLMAIGAWQGIEFTVKTSIFSIFLAGALAICILLFKGKLFPFLRKLYRFVLSLMVRELEVEFPKIDSKLKLPFGVPMALATFLGVL